MLLPAGFKGLDFMGRGCLHEVWTPLHWLLETTGPSSHLESTMLGPIQGVPHLPGR